MDPTTTLVAFTLQTDPSVHSVHLIGSWDNFSAHYPMERDIRKGRGNWRGCYAFKDIICDDDSDQPCSKRDGGLKMGKTYYYYYELDGSTEVHDPAMPSTTFCPYMPGQEINSLSVPEERTMRKRSASLNSMHRSNYKTMKPDDKFVCPRPAPAPPALRPPLRTAASNFHNPARLDTAPATFQRQKACSSRSSSPLRWRRLLGLNSTSHDSDRGRPTNTASSSLRAPSAASGVSESSRSRDISPDSLLRFLTDDNPIPPVCPALGVNGNQPVVLALDDYSDEEDDGYFITSVVPELSPYVTTLSPPPCKRKTSPLIVSPPRSSQPSPTHSRLLLDKPCPPLPQKETETRTKDGKFDSSEQACLGGVTVVDTAGHRSHFSMSTVSSVASILTPNPPTKESSVSSKPVDRFIALEDSKQSGVKAEAIDRQSPRHIAARQTGHSLPGPVKDKRVRYSGHLLSSRISALARFEKPISSGLDGFVSEVRWMMNLIGDKPS